MSTIHYVADMLIELNVIPRRSLEASQRFCHSNHIEHSTQQKITAYFQYMSERMGNNLESADLALLSSPALRSEFVLHKCWKSLKKISYLDGNLFDKVSVSSKFIFDTGINVQICCSQFRFVFVHLTYTLTNVTGY